MAAGLGFKTFVSGDVLTAADTNGYLMQGVWVFANAAARTSAVTSPQEGNVSFLKDTNSLEIYDGAAWVAYGSGDITGVTAGTGLSGGGTSGDVTLTNTVATAFDAKGDLVAGTGADTFARLAVGANNTVLTADSTTATGLKWATPSSGKNYSLVSSVSLTGAATITISGITDADSLFISVQSASSASAASTFSIRFNSDTGSNYFRRGVQMTLAATYDDANTLRVGADSDSIAFAKMNSAATDTVSGGMFVFGGNSAGLKLFNSVAGGNGAAGDNAIVYWTNGLWNNSATISSVSIISDTGNFDAGTFAVYKSA